LIVEKLKDGKAIINLKPCGVCKEQIIEIIQAPIKDETSLETVLYKIIQNKSKDLKIKYDSFMISCPNCRDKKEGASYMEVPPEEIEILNETPLSNIYLTVNPI
jgi:hypothetical protein